MNNLACNAEEVNTPFDQFLEALSHSELAPVGPHRTFTPNGRWCAYASAGEKPDTCRLIFHPEGYGYAKNWRTGQEFKHNSGSLTHEQITAIMAEFDATAEAIHTEAAQKAVDTWAKAAPAPEEHPYLKRKQIKPHGVKVDSENRLIIPMQGISGEVQTLAFIAANSDKRYLQGGQKKGAFYPLVETDNGPLILAEGFATAASITEALPTVASVYACFDAGNLEPVAKAMRKKYPQKQIIICGDDDAEQEVNIGKVKAQKAAGAVGGVAIFPDEPGDYNDLAVENGLWYVSALLAEQLDQITRTKSTEIIPAAPISSAILSLGTKLDETELATAISDPDHFISNRGAFWSFSEDAGIWSLVPPEEITKRIQALCRQAGVPANSSRVKGTAQMAHGVFFRDVDWDSTDPRSIAIQGGILTFVDGRWDWTEYRAEEYRRVSLPIEYDPDATCPRFNKFLEEIFAGAEDAEGRALALLELIGLSLTASTEFEKGALLIGSGANGKSVTLRLLADMLGSYAAGVNPAEFDNRFQRASLDGKLANLVSELPEGATLPDAAIKSIISGEAVTVEHKNQAPFVMVPRAKLWIGTNHLPSVRDFSPALFRRFTVLTFPNQFPEATRDVKLSEKLRAEIPGILNKCLDALGDTFDRGYLTAPSSSIDALSQWKRDSDQVLTFLEDEMVREPGAQMPSADVYSLYRQWANAAGIQRVVNRNNFTRRVKSLRWATDGKGAGGTRYLFGICPNAQGGGF